MSTVNLTGRVRISADVRFQPQNSDEDERYYGDVGEKMKSRQKAGAWAEDSKQQVKGGEEGVEVGGKTVPRPSSEAAPPPLESPSPPAKRTIAELKSLWGFENWDRVREE